LNRKLIFLNVVLLLVVVYAGMQFRDLYRDKKARELAQQRVKVTPVAPPSSPPLPPASPVLATTYAPIAQKLLLAKDRNPDVPVELPPAPPPPPPIPPLPVYHGMLNFGDSEGIITFMSLANSKAQKSVHVGESIGEFKLVAVSKNGIDLEWREQKVHKTLDEMSDHTHGKTDGSSADAGGAAAPPPAPVPAALPPAERPPAAADEGNGIHRCQQNDTNPAGTIIGNLRKVVKPSPFGPQCYWEPVGR
jgi:hypothetical protein